MNDDVLRGLLERLSDLERRPRYRQGVVTAAAPLAVALGGSAVPYTSVQTVRGPHLVGQIVGTLTFGNDMIVLGVIEAPSWRTIGAGGEPAFENSWVNFDAPTQQTATFRRIGDRVYVRGLVKNGTNNTMFTLPVGYRPLSNQSVRFVVVANGGYGQVEVNAAGNIVFQAGSNGYVDLSPVQFSVT